MVLEKSICLFCGRPASTRDHIPSKCLLEKPYPLNLLTIPSCEKCNKSFSMDEEYFINILVEISSRPALVSKKLDGSVFRARQRSIKLRNRIENSFLTGDDGNVYIKPEYERIEKIIEKNALGLYYKKYNLSLRLKDFKCTGIYPANTFNHQPTEIYVLTLGDKSFMPRKWTIIQDGVFSYVITKDFRRNNKSIMIFNIHHTIWAVIDIPYPNYRIRKKKSHQAQIELFS
jgi:hypothetical protein